ncbi:unnamed protein product [Staurois parvus]|uniref:Uncharacterized protein n=1 Tax=Staurois parvus TaxID=386267 RepID=A0ABN9FYS2_9NEOB|nr:unnamed protein product [Staurois parvus]
MYTQTHVRTYTQTHTDTHVHTHTCTDTHMYIPTDTQLYMLTQTHTNTHTCHVHPPHKELQYFVVHSQSQVVHSRGRQRAQHTLLALLSLR